MYRCPGVVKVDVSFELVLIVPSLTWIKTGEAQAFIPVDLPCFMAMPLPQPDRFVPGIT